MSEARAATYLDVTDLVEFLQRKESVSGVQRVVVETTPRILAMDSNARAVVLDRTRGFFIALNAQEQQELITAGVRTNPNRDKLAQQATRTLNRAQTAQPINTGTHSTLVFLGALWIADSLMLAARDAHARGTRSVTLLYDLTPVMETGHTAAVNRLFDRYLHLIATTASRVPTISRSSRNDFVDYCSQYELPAPDGGVTGLPGGLAPTQPTHNPWPRPYVLFVGTIESRKNHLLALNAWQELINTHGAGNVPDLVCIGRLGWNSNDFIDQYLETGGLGGKVSVLSTSLSDGELASFYEHCEFTIYPSRYEGWGLPVSESLAFSKVPIVANNSSLPEAGGDLAVYFNSEDQESLVAKIEQYGLNEVNRREREELINQKSKQDPGQDTMHTVTWDHVASVLINEIETAQSKPVREAMYPEIVLGKEYVLAINPTAPDAGHADQYFAHKAEHGATPLLQQQRDQGDYQIVDSALRGNFGSPQTWGYQVRPGNRIDLTIQRPVSGELIALLATRSMPGVVTVATTGPGGPRSEQVYLGSVLELNLGSGAQGEGALVSFNVTDATDSIEKFLGIRSFVILEASDQQGQVLAHKSAAQALRQELDYLTNTRSWKVTAPLRKRKGRGSN